jgi:hypothetical protein
LAPKPVFSLSTGACEVIVASLSKIKVLVIAIYRPGSATHADFSLILQKLRHHLEQVTGTMQRMDPFILPHLVTLRKRHLSLLS